MKTEEYFQILITELTKANISFQKTANSNLLLFNGHSCYQKFKEHLYSHYHHYSEELSSFINNCQSNAEIISHLNIHINMLKLSYDQIGVLPTLVSSSSSCTNNSAETEISIPSEELSKMITFFHFQRKIVDQTIDLLKNHQDKHRGIANDPKHSNGSWIDEGKGFYLYFVRIKDKLSQIHTPTEKINYLQNERVKLAEELDGKGIDIFKSPLNLFFEARIDCYRDCIVYESNKANQITTPLGGQQNGPRRTAHRHPSDENHQKRRWPTCHQEKDLFRIRQNP